MIKDNWTSSSFWWYFDCFCTGWYFELGYNFVSPWLLSKTGLSVMTLCVAVPHRLLAFALPFVYNDLSCLECFVLEHSWFK
jgi:hypothetical protein